MSGKLDIKRHSPIILYISASLAFSTSILEALAGKLGIKRYSPSSLYYSKACDLKNQMTLQLTAFDCKTPHELANSKKVLFTCATNECSDELGIRSRVRADSLYMKVQEFLDECLRLYTAKEWLQITQTISSSRHGFASQTKISPLYYLLFLHVSKVLFTYKHFKNKCYFTPKEVLYCQPRVTVTSCFVYKVIRDLESIDYLCINPIREDRINTQVIYRFTLAQVACTS